MSATVVIADDEAALRQLLRLLIERDARLTVIGDAADGKEAVEVVEQLDPDILLLDLGMPVMDGLQVLEALRGRDRPRIVVLTGFADRDTQQRACELGAEACVVKGKGFAGLIDVLAADQGGSP